MVGFPLIYQSSPLTQTYMCKLIIIHFLTFKLSSEIFTIVVKFISSLHTLFLFYIEEQNNDSDVKESSHQKTHKSSSLQDSKNSSDVSMLSDDEKQSDFIDPGDDLIKAANILNSIKTINPLLQGLTDYLVDEGNAEEELLLLGR